MGSFRRTATEICLNPGEAPLYVNLSNQGGSSSLTSSLFMSRSYTKLPKLEINSLNEVAMDGVFS